MDANEIEIRRLTGEDAAPYQSIRLESLRLYPETFSATFEMESAQSPAWFAGRLTQSQVVGAFHVAEIVGIAGLLVHHGNCAHSGRLIGVYVQDSYRNLGIGRRLVEAILEIAAERIELIQLSVLTENEPARWLYTSLGFQEYGLERKSHKYAGRYYDQILMAKDLAR